MKNRRRDDILLQRVSESLNGRDYRGIARMETALHESAHIVIALILGEAVEAVSLGTSGLGGGAVFMRPRSRDVYSLRRHMIVVAAGTAVDGLPLPAAGSGENSEDQNQLRSLAVEIVGKIGTQKRIDREILRAKSKAAKLVKRHKVAIEELAGHLLTLYGCLNRIKG